MIGLSAWPMAAGLTTEPTITPKASTALTATAAARGLGIPNAVRVAAAAATGTAIGARS
jgi:hypothetical protein